MHVLVDVYGCVDMIPLKPNRDRLLNSFNRKSLLIGPVGTVKESQGQADSR
jgi:hypothetical protein